MHLLLYCGSAPIAYDMFAVARIQVRLEGFGEKRPGMMDRLQSFLCVLSAFEI